MKISIQAELGRRLSGGSASWTEASFSEVLPEDLGYLSLLDLYNLDTLQRATIWETGSSTPILDAESVVGAQLPSYTGSDGDNPVIEVLASSFLSHADNAPDLASLAGAIIWCQEWLSHVTGCVVEYSVSSRKFGFPVQIPSLPYWLSYVLDRSITLESNSDPAAAHETHHASENTRHKLTLALENVLRTAVVRAVLRAGIQGVPASAAVFELDTEFVSALTEQVGGDTEWTALNEINWAGESILKPRVHNPRNVSIVAARLGVGGYTSGTLQEVADRTGLTRERVRQIVSKSQVRLSEWGVPVAICLDTVRSMYRPAGLAEDIRNELVGLVGLDQNSTSKDVVTVLKYFDEASAPSVVAVAYINSQLEFLVWDPAPCDDCRVAAATMDRLDSHPLIERADFESRILSDCKTMPGCSLANCHLPPSHMVALINHLAFKGRGWVFDGARYFRFAGVERTGGDTLRLARQVLLAAGEALHFTVVAERMRAEYGSTASLNAVHGALDRDRLTVLWDRGTFIHTDCAPYPAELMNKVRGYAFDRILEDGLPYLDISGLYDAFHSELQDAGIPTKSALYFTLERLDIEMGSALTFPKYPQVYLADGYTGRLNRTRALEQYVSSADGPVHRDDLRSYATKSIGLEEYQYGMAMAETTEIVPISSTHYAAWSRLEPQLSDEAITAFIAEATIALDGRKQMSIVALRDELLPSAIAAGLTTPELTYTVLRKRNLDNLSLPGYPHVALSGADSTPTRSIKDLIQRYVDEHGGRVYSAAIYREFVGIRQYNANTVNGLTSAMVTEGRLIRWGNGELVSPERFGVNDSVVADLTEILDTLLVDSASNGMRGVLVDEAVDMCHAAITLESDLYWDDESVKSLIRSLPDYALVGFRDSYFVRANERVPTHSAHDLAMDALRRTLAAGTRLTVTAARKFLVDLLIINSSTGEEFVTSLPEVNVSEDYVSIDRHPRRTS